MAKYNQRVRRFKRGFSPLPSWMNLNLIIIDRSGIAACIAKSMVAKGWNGYVLIPKGHKYFNVSDYNDIPYEVHGGITFAQNIGSHYIIGWHCAHSNSGVFHSERGKELSIKETLYLYEQAKKDMLPFWKRFFNWIK